MDLLARSNRCDILALGTIVLLCCTAEPAKASAPWLLLS